MLAASELGNGASRAPAAGTRGPAAVGAAAPRAALIAALDARAATLLREAVAEVAPDSRVEQAGALRQARRLLPAVQPDLVLIDLNMVEGTLGDFIAEATGSNGRVRVIVVAGHGDDDRILPALRAGAAGFVLKYDAPAVIVEGLRESLFGGPSLSRALARQLIRHIDRTGLGAALSASEREILIWIANGDTLAQAARRMALDPAAAARQVGRIFEALSLGPPGWAASA